LKSWENRGKNIEKSMGKTSQKTMKTMSKSLEIIENPWGIAGKKSMENHWEKPWK